MRVARVVIAAPSPVLRAGVRAALDGARSKVVGEAGSYAELWLVSARTSPDVCLLDSEMPGDVGTGIRTLLRRLPETAVLVLGDQDDDERMLLTAVRAGATGFLIKDIDLDQLPHAVDAMASGEALIPRRLVVHLLDQLRESAGGRRSIRPELPRLTEREQQVLDLLRQGWSTRRIADELFVAQLTVRTHVAAILHKYRVSDRRDLLDAPADPKGRQP